MFYLIVNCWDFVLRFCFEKLMSVKHLLSVILFDKQSFVVLDFLKKIFLNQFA